MIKLLSEEEIKLCKRFRFLSLMFAIVFPAVSVFLFNGGELLIFYYSEVHEIVAGSVAAQILSILNSIISSALFVCALVVLCGSVMTFGVSKSKLCILYTFISTVVSEICSFAVLYILVYTGNHDYTPSMLKSQTGVIFDVALINVFVYLLITLACFIMFYFSSGMESVRYSDDKGFVKKIKILFITVSAIKVLSYIMDVAFTSYSDGFGVNEVVSGIVLPAVYIALELFVCRYAIKLLIIYFDRLVIKYGIDLNKVNNK